MRKKLSPIEKDIRKIKRVLLMPDEKFVIFLNKRVSKIIDNLKCFKKFKKKIDSLKKKDGNIKTEVLKKIRLDFYKEMRKEFDALDKKVKISIKKEEAIILKGASLDKIKERDEVLKKLLEKSGNFVKNISLFLKNKKFSI